MDKFLWPCQKVEKGFDEAGESREQGPIDETRRRLFDKWRWKFFVSA
jgi:hypothetical protein